MEAVKSLVHSFKSFINFFFQAFDSPSEYFFQAFEAPFKYLPGDKLFFEIIRDFNF